MFPFGAVIAAASIAKRQREEEERKKKEKKLPTSEITVFCNDEEINVNYFLENDFDLARAAWALFKVCEEKGQKENLMRILKEDK